MKTEVLEGGGRALSEPVKTGHLAALAELAELADLAYFQVDAERNVVAMSPALERLTGFRAEDVLGRSCLAVIRCTECLRGCGVFKHGVVRNARIKIFREDGSELDAFKSGKVLRDDVGSIVGAIEVVRPVNEPAVREPGPPPELDVLLKSLGREFVVADDGFRIVSQSAGISDLVGLPAKELIGKPLEELFGEDLFGSDSSLRAAVLAGERREGWRAYLRTASGDQLPVSVSVGSIEASDACAGLQGSVSVMIRPEAAAPEKPAFGGIISRSPAMQRIFRVIELLRDNDSTVLISGESGTGKELVARALHATSHRGNGPFIAVNCAAIPSELLESELFGHMRGSFTGAVRDRPGRFELAHGGTLFLDEIGDLALSLQAKLLRFLQEHTFERVGDTRTRKVDVRVIAATHVNLVRAVSERHFREDLYYRLRVVPIEIPPLRERRQDLELLIRHFLQQIGKERGRSLRLAPSASRALLTYPWPGNVRELENALEYAISVCEGQTIHIGDLPLEVGRHDFERYNEMPAAAQRAEFAERVAIVEADAGGNAPGARLSASELAESARIREALEATKYNRGAAAQHLGISRTTLWRKMKQYRL